VQIVGAVAVGDVVDDVVEGRNVSGDEPLLVCLRLPFVRDHFRVLLVRKIRTIPRTQA
jgi:hypothetical protein